MEAWLLREWQRNSFWQILLRPISWVYALLAGARRGLYRAGFLKSEKVAVPVIVVGNVSVGGTGKTPLVLAIVQHLVRSGRHCGVISRGYARHASVDGVLSVAPNAASNVVGDEALLLANRSGVPVYVSSNRVAAARSLLKDHPEVDVLVSDDGLQHYALNRDVDICVIDGVRGFGNGALLPAGPLREPVSRLAQFDAIVINGSGVSAPRDLGIEKISVPAFSMSLGNESLQRVSDGISMSITGAQAAFAGKRIHAIAGIGNPERFFAHLGTLGIKLANVRSFPDHHPYAASDFSHIEAEIVLMTEKDAVKCKAFADERMWFLRVEALLPDAFGEILVKRLSELKK